MISYTLPQYATCLAWLRIQLCFHTPTSWYFPTQKLGGGCFTYFWGIFIPFFPEKTMIHNFDKMRIFFQMGFVNNPPTRKTRFHCFF